MTDKGAIARLLKEHQPHGVRIDLGCGANKQPDCIGMDARPEPGVDIVHNLEVYPWPLPDGCAALLIASHLVEHINPLNHGFIKFMDEAWRVMRPGGTFLIAAPYAGSMGYWADPTHVNPVTELTFTYFDPLHVSQGSGIRGGNPYSIYRPKPWQIEQATWDEGGQLEVALRKRQEDPSYG